MYESNKYDWILSIGIPLHEEGVSSWALTAGQAREVLNDFLIYKIPVLGGDVYERFGDVLQLNYDGWSLEKELGETDDSFVVRSIDASLKYIENYDKNIKSGCFYVICPDYLNLKERKFGKVINSTTSDRIGYIVSLLESFLKPNDVKVVKEFNDNDNPSLAIEVLVMILSDEKIKITQRIYLEIIRILKELGVETSIAEGLSVL
jgi:hypothetical protein